MSLFQTKMDGRLTSFSEATIHLFVLRYKTNIERKYCVRFEIFITYNRFSK